MASPEQTLRIGIFGGSFNPVHNGHIYAAKAVYQYLKLDRMLIIPSAIPPHKKLQGNADSYERLEMAKIAFSGIEGFEVLDIEIRRQGVSYTIDTVRELMPLYPNAEFYLIMGTDMYLTIENWHEGEQIIKLVTLVAVPRLKEEFEKLSKHSDMLKEKYHAKTIILDLPPVEISSTEVRNDIDIGAETENQIPQSIARYIEDRGLYR
jgi:nicotinate-nucleotide adenylyltransferase